MDLAQFVLLPLLSCWALWRFARVSPKHYGLGRLVHDEDPISSLIFFGFVTFIFTFAYPVGRVIASYFPWFWGPSSFTYAQALPINPAWAIVVVLFYSFSAGLVEEVFYRGLLALYLSTRLSPQRFKLIFPLVSALSFALIHWENGSRELIATFVFGLLAACFYLMIRNLWPLIVGHAFTDLFAYAGVSDF